VLRNKVSKAESFYQQKPSLLITGASGFIGGSLLAHSVNTWNVFATYCHSKTLNNQNKCEFLPLNILDEELVFSTICKIKPTVVIHCAAIPNLEYCALHEEEAFLVNAKGTESIVRACNKIGSRLVYLSTDLVFDGRRGFYSEESKPNPTCAYGKTKNTAENIVLSLSNNFCISRIAWTYGRSFNFSRCFTELMIDRLKCSQSITLFTDEYRSPIYVNDLCSALLELAQRNDTGIINLAGPERMNRYDFGILTAKVFDLDEHFIIPTNIDSASLNYIRPHDCSLNNTKAANLLMTTFSNPKLGLRKMLQRFLDRLVT